eukprot:scaffold171944_cov39-Attheya_sp.AAC.1
MAIRSSAPDSNAFGMCAFRSIASVNRALHERQTVFFFTKVATSKNPAIWRPTSSVSSEINSILFGERETVE